jgi:hypothetical protein
MSRYFLYPFYNKNRKRSGFFARSWILFCGSFEVFESIVTDRDRATVLPDHAVVAEATFAIEFVGDGLGEGGEDGLGVGGIRHFAASWMSCW